MGINNLNLGKTRTPSDYRNLLEVRVRRLSHNKSLEDRLLALREISAIAKSAIRDEERKKK